MLKAAAKVGTCCVRLLVLARGRRNVARVGRVPYSGATQYGIGPGGPGSFTIVTCWPGVMRVWLMTHIKRSRHRSRLLSYFLVACLCACCRPERCWRSTE